MTTSTGGGKPKQQDPESPRMVCPFLGADGKVRPTEFPVWKIMLPMAITVIVVLTGAAWSLGGKMASMEKTIQRIEQQIAPREVVQLQLESIRLELRAADLKITQHITEPPK